MKFLSLDFYSFLLVLWFTELLAWCYVRALFLGCSLLVHACSSGIIINSTCPPSACKSWDNHLFDESIDEDIRTPPIYFLKCFIFVSTFVVHNDYFHWPATYFELDSLDSTFPHLRVSPNKPIFLRPATEMNLKWLYEVWTVGAESVCLSFKPRLAVCWLWPWRRQPASLSRSIFICPQGCQ